MKRRRSGRPPWIPGASRTTEGPQRHSHTHKKYSHKHTHAHTMSTYTLAHPLQHKLTRHTHTHTHTHSVTHTHTLGLPGAWRLLATFCRRARQLATKCHKTTEQGFSCWYVRTVAARKQPRLFHLLRSSLWNVPLQGQCRHDDRWTINRLTRITILTILKLCSPGESAECACGLCSWTRSITELYVMQEARGRVT